MKRSSIVFIDLIAIFLIYGIATAPLNMGPVHFSESVSVSLVLGIIIGYIIS